MLRNNKLVLLISVVIVTAMIYLRDFGFFEFSSVQLAAVSVALALLMPYNEFMAYLFFLFPLIPGLPASYIIPLLSVLWVFKNKKRINIPAICFFLFFASLELIHFGFYTFEKDILFVVRYLSCLFLFVMCFADNSDSEEYNRRALFFCIGVAVLIVGVTTNTTILVGNIAEYGGRVGEVTLLDESMDGVIRLSLNPNGLAFLSLTATAISMSFLSQKKGNSALIISILVLSLVAGVLSLSRTWVVAFAFTILVYLLSGRASRTGKFVGYLCVVGAAAFLVVKGSVYIDAFAGRFGDETVSSAGSRTGIFSTYHNFMFEHIEYLFFGTGAAYYNDVVNATTSVHNSIQQVFVSYGIVGLAVFAIAASKIWLKNRGGLVIWLPVLSVFLFMQAIQFLNPFFNMFPILAAFQVVRGYENKIMR